MIEVNNLVKRYGDHKAVDHLSFSIEKGKIYGFLGPNGAGKSTTMNMITGYIASTEGSVVIDGHDILEEPEEAKKCIGYLPEQPPLYMNETPEEYLRFVGEAKGLHGLELKNQIEEVMEQTGIEQMRGRRISALSKGYRQRVGIAQALLGNPQVIVLDEPTVGLDPLQIIEIRDLIRELGRTHTVIFSSHILSEVQTICDQIIMIAHGKLVAFDTPEHLERTLMTPNEITITAEAPEDEVKAALSGVPGITDIDWREGEQGLVTACIHTGLERIHEASRAIFFAFADRRIPLLEMSLKKASLEDVFLELTEASPHDENGAEGEVEQG